MAKPKIPPIRKAEMRNFGRDIARQILEHRKLGINQDAGGRIARALEEAYRQGILDAPLLAGSETLGPTPDSSTSAPLELAFLPQRSRHGFIDLCLAIYGIDENSPNPRRESTSAYLRFNGDWQVQGPSGTRTGDDYLFASIPRKFVGPLVKHGLLREDGERLVPTRKAYTTWAAWLADPDNEEQIARLRRLYSLYR